MATGTYRQVYINFWHDPFILDLTMKEKCLYIYLITNEYTNICGIYELPLKVVSIQLSMSEDEILMHLNKFEDCEKIKYSPKTGEVCIRNFLKYNANESPKTQKGIIRYLEYVKDKSLIKYLNGLDKLKIYPIQEVLNDQTYPIEAVCTETEAETETDTDTETEAEKPLPVGMSLDVTLTYDGNCQHEITQHQIDEWQKEYPMLDVYYQLKRARNWLISNPYRCKSIPAVQSFVTNWLEREVNIRGSTDGHNSKNSGFEQAKPKHKLGIHL